jgi:hypothetical protein
MMSMHEIVDKLDRQLDFSLSFSLESVSQQQNSESRLKALVKTAVERASSLSDPPSANRDMLAVSAADTLNQRLKPTYLCHLRHLRRHHKKPRSFLFCLEYCFLSV